MCTEHVPFRYLFSAKLTRNRPMIAAFAGHDSRCDPEIFKAVMQHPAPGDIHDVSHRAPASVQHGGPAAIDVDGPWQGQLLELVPENQAPRPSVVGRDCSG